jgi:DNA-directed RNA polymerase subunit RPC12/RpoP
MKVIECPECKKKFIDDNMEQQTNFRTEGPHPSYHGEHPPELGKARAIKCPECECLIEI